MKQDEKTIEKKLSDLFDAARSEKSPLSRTGLSELLGQPYTPSLRNRLLNIKTILMTTSIVTVGAIVALTIFTASVPGHQKHLADERKATQSEVQTLPEL